jgi:hypothetical protein
MDTWSRLSSEFANCTVVVAVPALEVPAPDCEASKSLVRVLIDPERQTARRFNARWLPRVYALDEHGVITYVQSETTLDPQTPLQVAALWRSESPAGIEARP